MKSAVGSSMVVYLIITVVIFMIAFFAVSISYSKAFRVNNAIVNSLETNREFVREDIESLLADVGYKINSTNNRNNCNPPKPNGSVKNPTGVGTYRYCVYEYTFNRGDLTGRYYAVTTYMYFDMLIFSGHINFEIPVSGETRVFYD